MTTVCSEWLWGFVGEEGRWCRTMCLDCPVHKQVSDWFGHVQVAPAVLSVELEMAYLDGCSDIWESITPAQGRIHHQHCTRVALLPVLMASRHHAALWARRLCYRWWCGSAETAKVDVKPVPVTGGIRGPSRATSFQLREGPLFLSVFTVPLTSTFLRSHSCSFWLFLEARMRSSSRLEHVRCGMGFYAPIAVERGGVNEYWRVMQMYHKAWRWGSVLLSPTCTLLLPALWSWYSSKYYKNNRKDSTWSSCCGWQGLKTSKNPTPRPSTPRFACGKW